jgi:hypothetical protein
VITVTIQHPNGRTREVLLADIPRVGEAIRLANGRGDERDLIVEYVTWVEGVGPGPDPGVILSVRPSTNGPHR